VSSARISPTADVVVIGGGLIGTSIGWRLRQAGVDVVVVVGERAAAASRVAAGMLAPVTEATFTEQRLLQLNLASLGRYSDFVAELEHASGQPSAAAMSRCWHRRFAAGCWLRATGAATTGCSGRP
jgi:glycine/D-amino acid oxidase-like deaminating enzyme